MSLASDGCRASLVDARRSHRRRSTACRNISAKAAGCEGDKPGAGVICAAVNEASRRVAGSIEDRALVFRAFDSARLCP